MKSYPIVHCVFPLGLSRLFTLGDLWVNGDHPWTDQSQLFTVFSSSAATSQLKAWWKPRFVRAFSAQSARDRSITADDNWEHTNNLYIKSVLCRGIQFLISGTRCGDDLSLTFAHHMAADCDKIHSSAAALMVWVRCSKKNNEWR
jgi:hypothetical protein